VIRDSDSMVTEATGDINIGKYEFRLTVKDAEMLTSSATLTFNVKKGSSSVSSFIVKAFYFVGTNYLWFNG